MGPRYWNYEALPCAKCGDIHDGPCAGPTSETGSTPAGAREVLTRLKVAFIEERGKGFNWSKYYDMIEAVLAKNESASTVCPAGPVVEGELRAARLQEAKWWIARDWLQCIERIGLTEQQERFGELAGIASKSELIETINELDAALTNDPPPSEHEGGR